MQQTSGFWTPPWASVDMAALGCRHRGLSVWECDWGRVCCTALCGPQLLTFSGSWAVTLLSVILPSWCQPWLPFFLQGKFPQRPAFWKNGCYTVSVFPKNISISSFSSGLGSVSSCGDFSGGGSGVLQSWTLWSEMSEFESQFCLLVTFSNLLNLSKSVNEGHGILPCEDWNRSYKVPVGFVWLMGVSTFSFFFSSWRTHMTSLYSFPNGIIRWWADGAGETTGCFIINYASFLAVHFSHQHFLCLIHRLSLCNPNLWNLICSRIQNFHADMTHQWKIPQLTSHVKSQSKYKHVKNIIQN